MNTVTTKDGTRIAYEKKGDGPALILIDGALCSRSQGPNGPLAALLQKHFTVYTYDRRGRGGSGNSSSYSIDYEIQDLEALIREAGGTVHLYGISSGAALALEAANRLSSVNKLALYEAPFIVDDSRAPLPATYRERMESLLASGKRSAAVKHFMRAGVGLPAPLVAIMPLMPAWSKLKAVAHTLPYDTLLTMEHQRGSVASLERWASLSVPSLVVAGGKSPQWMRNAMHSLAHTLPSAQLETLPGQTHIVKPSVLAPVLQRFFLS
ncbi:alpha/beta hydrolase [Paenibacillus sp. CC-CFT747]|nr:alpha/beta hydrolase [Paenibacillus sp. CC-CFT747]